MYHEIYFKGLTHVIVGTGKSKICREGWQAGILGRSKCCSFEAKLLWKILGFALKASNQLDETHPH